MSLSSAAAGFLAPPRARRIPLVTFVAAALAMFPAMRVSAAPQVIETDTIWEGTVDAGEGAHVLKGATLLIQPGTTVRFAPTRDEAGNLASRLFVNGTIIAQGTAEKPITFMSSAKEARRGAWGGIVVEKSVERANLLRHVVIRDALIGISGTHSILVAEDIAIRDCVTGLYAFQELNGWVFQGKIAGNDVGLQFNQNSTFHVEDCEITGNARAGVLCVLSSSPKIRFSTIADNGESGIHCVQGSSPLIAGNTIRGHRRGVSMELQTRPWIVQNMITGNETGISGEKMVFPRIEGNVITGNGTGIYCNYSAYMEIHGNNLHDNRTFGLVVGDNMSILMQNKIPFRHLGQFSFNASPPGADTVPHQSRKLNPFPENAGVVDARTNWWGAAATTEMEKLGENGNISVIEDYFDKPDTFYQEEVYRRDRVAFAPWEKEPVKQAGPPPSDYSGIVGKVTFNGNPVAGVRVHAYSDAEKGLRGEGQVFSPPTAGDGSFSLNVSTGTYYLVAKGPTPPFPFNEPGSDAFIGYFEGNPVTVGSVAKETANLRVIRRATPVVTAGRDPARIGIEGVVLGPAGPVAGAAVHVYTDAKQNFRGPDIFGPQGAVVGGTDAKGTFSLDLPPGTYFLVASKRQGSDPLGAPQPGDLYGYFDGNPLTPEPGTKTAITIQVAGAVDPAPGSRQAATAAKGKTGIRGKVTDPLGKVPQGVYVFASADPDFKPGAMPPHRSQVLGADGSYAIDLPSGGTYYVGARSGDGGPPLPGEWHGFLGEKTPRPVTVETGRVVEGIDFVVGKME